MLMELLAYGLLGLLLGWPLLRLLQWLGMRSGAYQPRWNYLRPYVPADQRDPGASRAAQQSQPTSASDSPGPGRLPQ